MIDEKREYLYIRTKEENKGRDYTLDKVTPTSHVREAMLAPRNMVYLAIGIHARMRHGIFEHGEGILDCNIILCYIIRFRQMLALKFLVLSINVGNGY